MPPKAKYTKEEITEIALQLVCTHGEEVLTARGLGKALGTSSSPVFTVFKDMEEVKSEVFLRAKAIFDQYMAVAEDFVPSYKMRGMQWVKFAKDYPELFKMLFMHANGDGKSKILDNVFANLPFGKEKDIAIIKRDYNATDEQAEHLFGQMWTYSFGLCVLSANGICNFDENEIALRLGEIFQGMIYVIKKVAPDIPAVKPVNDKKDKEQLTTKNPDLQAK